MIHVYDLAATIVAFAVSAYIGFAMLEFALRWIQRGRYAEAVAQSIEVEPAKPQQNDTEMGRELAANYDAAVRQREVPIVMQFHKDMLVGVLDEPHCKAWKYATLLRPGERFFFCEPDSLRRPEGLLRWCVCLHSYYYGSEEQRRYYLLYMPSPVESVAQLNPTVAAKESQ